MLQTYLHSHSSRLRFAIANDNNDDYDDDDDKVTELDTRILYVSQLSTELQSTQSKWSDFMPITKKNAFSISTKIGKFSFLMSFAQPLKEFY